MLHRIGMANLIDEKLLRFVHSTLRSVWALELLLLMRSHADRRWSAEALTRELRASLALVAELLAHFHRCGLVAKIENEVWIWRPGNAELAYFAQATADAYAQTPFQVIKAILDAPNDRMRSFADAFKLRKEEE